MSQVDSTTNTASLPAFATQTSGLDSVENRASLLKDDFLKLLIAQLQNQDPMNPASNQEFAAQLAQFSSLEQLQQMNSTLGSNLTMNGVIAGSINNNTAANFIGKQVTAVGDQLKLEDSGDVEIRFSQSEASARTVMNIYDANGSLVRSMDMGAMQSGGVIVNWDGKDGQGNRLSAGVYNMEVLAADADDNAIDTLTFMTGEVTGVRYINNQATLLIGDQEVSLENVIEVLKPAAGDN